VISYFARARRTIGLDIGSGRVKAAMIDHSTEVPRLLRLASRPLPPGAIVDGQITQTPRIARVIGEVVEEFGVRTRSVVAAVGGPDIIVKKIRMPRMSEADAREVIGFEAERYVPFDMESVQLDFQILDPHQDGSRMSVLLVAAKRDLVNQTLQLLSEAGLSAAALDVEAFALFNALEFNYPDASHAPGALVDVGHDTTTLIVHERGVPLLSRDVPCGGRILLEDLQHTGSPRGEVYSASGSNGDLGGGADPRGNALVSEVVAAVERATSILGGEGVVGSRIEAVHLSGGGAALPGFQEAIANRLRVRTERVNPLQRLDVAPEAMVAAAPGDPPSMWVLSIGLALRSPG